MASIHSKPLTLQQRKEVLQWATTGLNSFEIAARLKADFGINYAASSVRRIVRKLRGTDSHRNNNQRVLIISDMHIPYQHPDTMRFLAAVKNKYRPTRCVCVGDEVDKHNLSFHDSDPDLLSAGDELLAAIKQLQPLYKLFPKMDLIDSNHGSMAYRKALHHGIPRKYLRAYGEVLEAPKGWQWHMELVLDLPNGNKVFFHHGLAKDVMNVVALRGLCVVQGHYHTEFRIGYIGNPAALLWGMNVGCLIDGKSMAFAYDRTNLGRPVIGTGIIIDGQPKLLPMVLGADHRWNGVVP